VLDHQRLKSRLLKVALPTVSRFVPFHGRPVIECYGHGPAIPAWGLFEVKQRGVRRAVPSLQVGCTFRMLVEIDADHRRGRTSPRAVSPVMSSRVSLIRRPELGFFSRGKPESSLLRTTTPRLPLERGGVGKWSVRLGMAGLVLGITSHCPRCSAISLPPPPVPSSLPL